MALLNRVSLYSCSSVLTGGCLSAFDGAFGVARRVGVLAAIRRPPAHRLRILLIEGLSYLRSRGSAACKVRIATRPI